MARFKVGDRVMASLTVSEMWVEDYGTLHQPARIISVGPEDYVIKLEKPCAKDDGEWIAVDNELTPAAPDVPDGWTPASEPPSGSKSARNVEIMLEDGKRGYGFYKVICSGWIVIDDGADIERIKSDWTYNHTAAPGEVVAWREIQPEPEEDAPYYVEYLTMDDEEQVRSGAHDLKTALDMAKVDARNSGRLVAVYRKVYEVRPGKPEVIKVEGK